MDSNVWKSYKSSVILLASMVVGGIVGYIWGEGATVLQPIADLFLNLLYCCVVPLIFCSLVAAITKMTDMKKLSRILITFIVLVFVTGIIASLFMLIPCLITDPAEGYVLQNTEEIEDFTSSFNILDIFTVSDFTDLLSRKNLMALIVFSVLFSFATLLIGEKGKKITEAMELLTEVITKLIGIIMKMAPVGLGCYFAILIGSLGGEVVGPIGKAIVMTTGVLVLYFVISQSAFAYIGAGTAGVRRWWATCVPSTLTALGTCSSVATLPTNMLHANAIGIPEEIADITIPLGATLHKDGACIKQIVKIAFTCSVFGINFAAPQNIFLAILVSVIGSVGVIGIPGGGYVVELLIASVFGFPTISIPIMILISTVNDAPSTAVNVAGDTGLAMVVARIIEGKDWFKKAEAKRAAQAVKEIRNA